ncbi:hypothetical protein A1F94_007741 [Pyrenophora tritici-repentis]|nr:hypothetical protein A1F94_007741 [Pyrenophora tritici-repentis]KAI0582816.1 hypothetical protein Alg215_03939 [Pyrenophora tritici-repentis]KAI1584641.1 hypothetical protein PtrEW7m1_002570 [Pyrenophora tritici-repentis]KAI1597581.1 hypothetical protein PtrEW13061_001422 [Pyrenophora tritici-repentis]PWO27514.1 phosphatidylinositol 4-kinase type II subunit alpha [Pyrenophora tritici-repentis]
MDAEFPEQARSDLRKDMFRLITSPHIQVQRPKPLQFNGNTTLAFRAIRKTNEKIQNTAPEQVEQVESLQKKLKHDVQRAAMCLDPSRNFEDEEEGEKESA